MHGFMLVVVIIRLVAHQNERTEQVQYKRNGASSLGRISFRGSRRASHITGMLASCTYAR
jgi:hypothetical protein